MAVLLLLLSLLSLTSSLTSLTSSSDVITLHRKLLSDFPQAVCNDGTAASYFLPSSPYTPGQQVFLYLEGGGACFDVQSCSERCEVSSPWLCTGDPSSERNFTGSVWSGQQGENPGLHTSYKVYVPYCTSDVYTGRRDAVEETGGYTFHGKYVLEAVMEELLTQVVGESSLGQFVLMGMSAGAFGVGNNCDSVADRIRSQQPSTDVRCVMDGLDFSPPWLHTVDNCDPYTVGKLAQKFWQGLPDSSCLAHYGEEEADQCLVFSSYHQFLETPFMVVVPYVDTNMEVHPCTPALDEDPEFWQDWRDGVQDLAIQLVQEHPEAGMFISNCPHHVSHRYPETWGLMKVAALDSSPDTLVTYKASLANWLQGDRPYQALDSPDAINPQCPFVL